MSAKTITGAVIEVGTNSVKYLLAKGGEDKGITPIKYTRKITRLGEGLIRSGKLKPGAVDRTITAIADYHREALEAGVDSVYVVGTHALRAAGNSDEFSEQLREKLGLEVSVMSGDQEADCTREGVLLDYKKIQNLETMIFDIGGGSTEIIKSVLSKSLPLGVVSITEDFFNSDPPADEELIKAETIIKDHLLSSVTFALPGDRIQAVGVGGTVMAVAALVKGLDEFDAEALHHTIITEDDVLKIFDRLVSVDYEERKKIMKIDPGRADVIIAGLLILRVLFRYFKVERFTVSVMNIIHGIFYRQYLKLITSGGGK